MMFNKTVMVFLLFCLIGAPVFEAKAAEKEKKSSDEIAKELSNPAGSLASLNLNIQYMAYEGDLRNSRDQGSTSLIFQPVLPFPVGDKGRRIIFRPAITLPFDQPTFNVSENDFDSENFNMADTGFDLFYCGTDKTSKRTGYLWGLGLAGTLPTATNDVIGGNQWRFGPEVFGGFIRKWGIVGVLVNNQWNTGGSNDEAYSVLNAQYFYAYGLGKGMQIASGPTVTYDWHADSDEALTLPIGLGFSKTAMIGNAPFKFQLQIQKFLEQPDSFGPDWLIKFTITPVVKNILASMFK
jgi:hypothetical protein